MSAKIGPIAKRRLVLCSADAGPDSQRRQSGEAQYFFRGARWVGAVRNAANDLGCPFVVLTTGFGLVKPGDLLEPYDKHISRYGAHVVEKWHQTVPGLLGNKQYDLMVFYAGGCPRDKYLAVLKPILGTIGLSLLTFGKPNMCDGGKIGRVATMILGGVSVDKLRKVLRYPERLHYYAAPEDEGSG